MSTAAGLQKIFVALEFTDNHRPLCDEIAKIFFNHNLNVKFLKCGLPYSIIPYEAWYTTYCNEQEKHWASGWKVREKDVFIIKNLLRKLKLENLNE